jgi:type IV secretion system protein TrbG
MDPRRLLILAALGLSLSGCAVFRDGLRPAAALMGRTTASAPMDALASTVVIEPEPALAVAEGPQGRSPTERAYETAPVRPATAATVPSGARDASAGATGRRAIAAANATARAPSREDAFVGGVQVFTWSPGRVFEIWTAPLRVTTLTLAPGETLVAKAAGDTGAGRSARRSRARGRASGPMCCSSPSNGAWRPTSS